jgi:hypothetical protein
MASATPTESNHSVFCSYGLPIGKIRILTLLDNLKTYMQQDVLASTLESAVDLADEMRQLLACSIYDPADSERIMATRLAALFDVLASDHPDRVAMANQQIISWWKRHTLVAPAVRLPVPDGSPLAEIDGADQKWEQMMARMKHNLRTDFRRVRRLLHLMFLAAPKINGV